MTRAGYSSIDELPLSAQARSLWGKTDRDAGEQWLPLYVHMSDSALVAKQIWDEWLPEGTRKIIADEFDGDAVFVLSGFLRTRYWLLGTASFAVFA